MDRESELVRELQEELNELHKDVGMQKLKEVPAEQIELRLADFELRWQDRLVDAQREETLTRTADVRERFDEEHRQAHNPASVKDNDLMRRMLKADDQRAYWESSAPSRNTEGREKDLARKLEEEVLGAAIETRKEYAAIRGAMEQSLIEIDNGREPDINVLITQQIEKQQQQDRRQGFDDLVRQSQQARERSRDR